MRLHLLRIEESDNGKATIGQLYINDVYHSFTLEDKVREDARPVTEWKVKKETAIPSGTYDVVIDMSARFKRLMAHVLNVPGFDGIRIHSGNTDADTEGCILLGRTHDQGADFIGESTLAFNAFFPKLQDALSAGEDCTITVETAIRPTALTSSSSQSD